MQDPVENLKNDPRAIWIPLDHPTVDLPLTHLESGNKTNLQKIGQDGITMVLSSTCGTCEKAVVLSNMLHKEYPTNLLFAGSPSSIKEFLKNFGVKDTDRVYLVNPKDLATYNIRTVPAILGYDANQLTMAFHGPVDATDMDLVINLHENRSKVMQ